MRQISQCATIAAGWLLVIGACSSDEPSPPGPAATGGTAAGQGDGGIDVSGGDGGVGGSDGSAGSAAAGSGGAAGGGGGSVGQGGAAGDAASAGTGTAGDDGGIDAGACEQCPNGICTDAGVCVECTLSEQCATPTAHCDLETNRCVQCLPAADDCPEGTYCSAQKTCARGCKNGMSCASGVCSASHGCERCVRDDECTIGRVCGSGVCGEPCTTGGEQAVDAAGTCGGGFSCCGTRCVDVNRDVGNCGVCGQACSSSEFCGTTGCVAATVANVCRLRTATAVLDDQPLDDAAANAVLGALGAICAPTPTTRAVSQLSADVINRDTGQVVVSGGELLVFAGGTFFNKAVQFLENQRSTPVYNSFTPPDVVRFQRSADQGVIVEGTLAASTASHDLIVIQVGREPLTGTPSLILYGFHENGTRAAAWHFTNVMLPDLASYTRSYYVYEWTDGNGDQTPNAADTFDLIESGD